MTKDDEKRLKKDPRYAAVRDAHRRLCVAYAEAQRIQLEAVRAFETATGLVARATQGLPLSDEQIFEALRPRGDKVRVGAFPRAEIESVSATTIRLVGWSGTFSLKSGKHNAFRVNECVVLADDLAKIKSGALKGWRQKPWPDGKCPPQTGVDPV